MKFSERKYRTLRPQTPIEINVNPPSNYLQKPPTLPSSPQEKGNQSVIIARGVNA